MKKKLLFAALIIFVLLTVLYFIIEYSVFENNNCTKRGEILFPDAFVVSIDKNSDNYRAYQQRLNSCCFGLVPYSNNPSFYNWEVSCEPFYYRIVDKFNNILIIFYDFYFWFYAIIILIVIFLIYWLIRKNIKAQNNKS